MSWHQEKGAGIAEGMDSVSLPFAKEKLDTTCPRKSFYESRIQRGGGLVFTLDFFFVFLFVYLV